MYMFNEDQPGSPGSPIGSPIYQLWKDLVPGFLTKFSADELETLTSTFVNNEIVKLGLVAKINPIIDEISEFFQGRYNELRNRPAEQPVSKEEMSKIQGSWNRVELLSDSVCNLPTDAGAEEGYFKTILDHLIGIKGEQFASFIGVKRQTLSPVEELFLRGILVKNCSAAFRILVLPFDRINERMLLSLQGSRIMFQSLALEKKIRTPLTSLSELRKDPDLKEADDLNKLDECQFMPRLIYNIYEINQLKQKWEHKIHGSKMHGYIAKDELDKVNNKLPCYWTIFGDYKNVNRNLTLSYNLIKVTGEAKELIEYDRLVVNYSIQSEKENICREVCFYGEKLKALAVINKWRSGLSTLREQIGKYYLAILEELLTKLTSYQGEMEESFEAISLEEKEEMKLVGLNFVSDHETHLLALREEFDNASRKEERQRNLARNAEKWKTEVEKVLRIELENRIEELSLEEDSTPHVEEFLQEIRQGWFSE